MVGALADVVDAEGDHAAETGRGAAFFEADGERFDAAVTSRLRGNTT